MAVIQYDPDKPNKIVNVDQANPTRLVVSPFAFPGGDCPGATLDLTSFQGGPARIYLDADGSISTDLYRDRYWLLAEAILPEKQFSQRPTGRVDENGQQIMEMVEEPLNLNEIDITVFPLPEVA